MNGSSDPVGFLSSFHFFIPVNQFCQDLPAAKSQNPKNQILPRSDAFPVMDNLWCSCSTCGRSVFRFWQQLLKEVQFFNAFKSLIKLLDSEVVLTTATATPGGQQEANLRCRCFWNKQTFPHVIKKPVWGIKSNLWSKRNKDKKLKLTGKLYAKDISCLWAKVKERIMRLFPMLYYKLSSNSDFKSTFRQRW